MTATNFASKRCKPCEAGIPPLTAEKIAELLQQTPGWSVNQEQTVISRKFAFKNFLRTMAFVNAVAYIANEEGHHPDIKLGFNYCVIDYTTHAIDGLSENDFICAGKINLLMNQ